MQAHADKYFARQILPKGDASSQPSAPPKKACSTDASYVYYRDPWVRMADASGGSPEDEIVRIGEAVNAPGWPGAAEACEKAIKGTRRTGCALFGQPVPGYTIGVFMTKADRPTTYLSLENEFLLVANPVTCSF